MAANYQKKTQTDNKHSSNATSARYYHIDGGQASKLIRPTSGRLLRVIVNTKGLAFVLRDGVNPQAPIVGNIAATTPEGTYMYGVYCANGISFDTLTGSGSATLVFDE